MLIKSIENLYEFIFNSVNDVILFLSEDGKILDANKTAVETYGYSHQELTSMYIHQIRHHSMDSDYLEYRTLHEEEGVIFEGIHIRKNGSAFPVEVNSKLSIANNHKFRVNIIRDITARRELESKIVYLANYDPLTNVANRASIFSQLDNAIEKVKFTGYDVACIMFDIDKFKYINDTFGHIIGDEVLKYVAQTIQSSLRTCDSIGRFGGDEFIVILQNIQNKKDLISLAGRICNIFKQPFIINQHTIKITISIGISLLSELQETENQRDELIHRADSAMYEAKKIEGCSFRFFNKNM